MWHFGIRFSSHGGAGRIVGLDDLRDLFQPMILWSYCLYPGRRKASCQEITSDACKDNL